jgi:acid stress chaperone HdeB
MIAPFLDQFIETASGKNWSLLRVIGVHLTEVTCETFIDKMKNEQSIIAAWLQGYYLPEHGPPVIDLDKVLADTAELREHCIDNPEDDIMAAAEAVFGK